MLLCRTLSLSELIDIQILWNLVFYSLTSEKSDTEEVILSTDILKIELVSHKFDYLSDKIKGHETICFIEDHFKCKLYAQ